MINRVISFWFDGRNLGVLSTTNEQLAEEMKRWAESKGFQVREGGGMEDEET